MLGIIENDSSLCYDVLLNFKILIFSSLDINNSCINELMYIFFYTIEYYLVNFLFDRWFGSKKSFFFFC